MRSFIRYSVVVFVGLSVSGAGLLAWSVVTGNSPLQPICDPFAMLLAEWNKQAELNERTESLLRRALLKSEIVERLVRDEITFRQAVEEFVAATEATRVADLEDTWEDSESSEFPEAARCVFAWLQQELRQHPEKETLLKKYRRQYRQTFAQPGI